MALVAAMISNQMRLTRLRTALRDRYAIIACEDWDDVRRTCGDEAVTIAVVDLLLTAERRFEELRHLRLQYPSLTTVLYTSVPPLRPRDLFEAGRFGIDGLVVADEDDEPRRLLALIEQAEARGIIGTVRDALADVRPSARDAALVAVTRAHQRLTPDRLAKVLGMRRKGLAAMLARARFPSPARLIAWGRLMVAARLLEDDGRTIDSVALSLDYPSGSAFRNLCQRYLQATPQEIRSRGATQFVLAAFLEDLRSPEPPLAGTLAEAER